MNKTKLNRNIKILLRRLRNVCERLLLILSRKGNKDERIYNYLLVPSQCFKSKGSNIVEYGGR